MAFHFTCPYCFKKTLVDEAVAGQSGPCAGCGKLVTIPAPPAKVPESAKPVDNRHVKVEPLHPQRPLLAWILKIAGLALGMGLLFFVSANLLWPTFQGLKVRRDKVASLNNLQRIAMALNNYAIEYGSYPPPVVYDAQGKPLYSWRVLILPQLGEASLYARFNLDEAWDSEENAALLASCPLVYLSPTIGSTQGVTEPNYVLLTGRGTLFPPAGPLSPQDIADGPENTLLVVETASRVSQWSEPWDLDVGKMNKKINASSGNAIGGNHEGGAAAAFADGTSAWLPEDLSPTVLNSLISPSGNEPVDPDAFIVQ